MKIQSILTMAALGLPFLASARPASPHMLRLHNPDGSIVEAQLHGDESFSFTTSADGLSILELNEKGFWKPAMRNGKQLRPVESDIKLLLNEQPAAPEITGAQKRMAALDKDGRSTFPTTGEEIHSPVVLLEFKDTKFTVPDIHQAIYNLCNKEGYDSYNAKGSARDFYRFASNGMFNPIFDVYGPVQLSENAVYYNGKGTTVSGAGRTGRFSQAIKESVTWLHENTDIDFSHYDYDEDGKVDNIFFFYAGHGQADTGNDETIWPHQGDYTERVRYPEGLDVPRLIFDGKEVATYACSNELDGNPPKDSSGPWLDGIGAFCHEFGHVIGLPDLYDTINTGTETPGKFSIMDQGSYNDMSTCPPTLSAYERWLCHWLEYTDLTDDLDPTDVSLASLTADGTQAARIRVRRPGVNVRYYPEYFVIESRSNDGWDAAMPQNDGLLIWRIDYDKNSWSNNFVNCNGKARIKIMAPNRENNEFMWPGYDNTYTVNYPGINGALETQSSYAPSFKAFLTDIKYDADNRIGSFGFNHLKDFPQETTVLHDSPEADASGKRQFTLQWDAVEGAEEYLVTIQRTDANGKQWYVDSCNERNVGNNTSLLVRNITATAWEQPFTAYVRVSKKGVPSDKTSNVISFTPSQLSSGITMVTPDELGVFGGKGSITAPEGAEVINLNGIRTGKDNLPAGIYLVRVENKTAKVLVK